MGKRGKKGKANEEKNDTSLLLGALIAVSIFFATSLLELLHSMLEWGYDVSYQINNCLPLYIPLFYIVLIIGFAYNKRFLLSKPEVRYVMKLTIIVIFLLSFFQLIELYPVFGNNVKSEKEIFDTYASNAIFHPLLLIILIQFYLYFEYRVLKKKKFIFYILTIFIMGKIFGALFWNFNYTVVRFFKLIGFTDSEGRIAYTTLCIVLAAVFLFLSEKISKRFPHFLWHDFWKNFKRESKDE